jgi:hypothetical protein
MIDEKEMLEFQADSYGKFFFLLDQKNGVIKRLYFYVKTLFFGLVEKILAIFCCNIKKKI